MSIFIKLLRKKILPQYFTYKSWQIVSKLLKGKKFFFNTEVDGTNIIYGGIYGLTTNSVFADFDLSEKGLIRVLKSILNERKENIIFDVGANNGQSLIMFKSIFPKSTIHCFEPFHELCNFMEELVRKNSFKDVYINEIILGNKTTNEGKLYFKMGVTDTASILKNFQSTFNSIRYVKEDKLDNYVSKNSIKKIDLLKIDVEGGELFVIEGSKKVIKHLRPNMLLELLYTEDEKQLKRQNLLLSFLKENDYKFYQITSDGEFILQKDVVPDKNYINLNYFVTISEQKF